MYLFILLMFLTLYQLAANLNKTLAASIQTFSDSMLNVLLAL